MEVVARQLAAQVSAQLPGALHQLAQQGLDPETRVSCDLTIENNEPHSGDGNQIRIAEIAIGRGLTPSTPTARSQVNAATASLTPSTAPAVNNTISRVEPRTPNPTRHSPQNWTDGDDRPRKRRKETRRAAVLGEEQSTATPSDQQDEPESRLQRRKRVTDNPALQPSSLEKLINGIWDSLYCGVRMDPTEIIAQWQTIESSSQPKLLTETNHDLTSRNGDSAFGRFSMLTRKISQTTRACRSLEVIVQAQWIQCFDDRVIELSQSLTREQAKRDVMLEACCDFSWTEKELRNKMAIWRGYDEIKNAAGWAALVFAGTGLYRFCKYRVSFSQDAFGILRQLKHRFELAADTLHPRWRTLLGIVGLPAEVKYKGHPHDWVVNGPNDEAIPLPPTYSQWHKNFSYTHLNNSVLDEDVWGDCDPRSVIAESDPEAFKCQSCGEHQSLNPVENACMCYNTLYGSSKPAVAPVQIFRTPDGKNNGLVACCPMEKGSAVGEFVGEITTGIKGLDVMIDCTERVTYQIWQGRMGNHTRFINHSCEPNSHYERFVWLGKQRSVLVSEGIAAGEEITVDYGNTYWEDLDKECLCGKPRCRYRRRLVQQLITPPNGETD